MTYVGIDVEALVVEHGGGELHHLCEDEEVLQAMRYLFGDELNEVRDQLVQAGIAPQTCESGHSVLVVGFV